MNTIKIINRFNGNVIWDGEAASPLDAVLKAKSADADLRGADLCGANLRDANLCDIKNDIFEILLHAPREVPGLIDAIKDGKIDGSVYSGKCCCLVGTIAKARQCGVENLDGIRPNGDRPAERWFLAFKPGYTPENSQVAKITLEWVEEFQRLIQATTGNGQNKP